MLFQLSSQFLHTFVNPELVLFLGASHGHTHENWLPSFLNRKVWEVEDLNDTDKKRLARFKPGLPAIIKRCGSGKNTVKIIETAIILSPVMYYENELGQECARVFVTYLHTNLNQKIRYAGRFPAINFTLVADLDPEEVKVVNDVKIAFLKRYLPTLLNNDVW